MTAEHGINQRQWLSRLQRHGGKAMVVACALPMLSGMLLVGQALLLSEILGRVIVSRQSVTEVLPAIGLFIGIFIARIGLGLCAESAGIVAAERIKLYLRRLLHRHIFDQRPDWMALRSSGALSSAVIDQTDALDGYFARFFPAMIQAAVLPIVFAMAVMPVDWIVALLFLLTAPLIPIFMALVGWGAQAATDAQAQAMSRLSGFFADRLRGIVTLKLFGRAESETTKVLDASHDLRLRTLRVLRIAFLSSAVLEFFAALGVAGVALYVGLSYLGFVHIRVAPFTLQAGLFCLLMAPEVYQPLRLLAAHYHDRQSAKAAIVEIAALFGDLPENGVETSSRPASMPLRGGAIAVAASHLGLATPDGGRRLLENATLSLAAGSHAALLGESGIGKSTLLEAIVGLRAFEGRICLEGHELQSIDPAGLRNAVAFLGQRPMLFAGTIADNIRFGARLASESDLSRAAELAGVLGFTNALPDGLNTAIGAGGRGVSGGEAQRIALARIFLRDPGLIVLDEPTAHLDRETESRVLDALQVFARGRTLLVATHSLAVAERFFHVFRVAGGDIVPVVKPRPKVLLAFEENAA
ncbi:thiol reductant ABC exporter subunit CydD [Rhizobium sp. VS19-DR104.2]|uniref:thiol reductant ABC exporter subunit CydD n=1 Tax=unclassified Rhizobium TaxID=2613769 RepID=UPI001CC5FC97|nr:MULTISPECIES: thiol reductant ABC exporter subunit CydD [unclassified Rhizobium]MBZ5761275.1 thiol reductant ABC exporter subunit CydD [Rhizobium sp. VS19-DR96]MBZ5767029.1 thiol reductant ABC exporter subunit CydD [Rhizobium sp. VS19-DR129.2]MBZ5774914.1 thiol reductant ABC exporter subunit CydD [Rhizobium sp. VS19-DRK62.2]MBZ5785707.1 thiol reductant ABC exporter subunit CydD [Rhizobium sp. VS19-DR121]MBZ5803133.1 thiol reductant ABC exporter subunit CydD [Rhizobium sp. VS19-DR181]